MNTEDDPHIAHLNAVLHSRTGMLLSGHLESEANATAERWRPLYLAGGVVWDTEKTAQFIVDERLRDTKGHIEREAPDIVKEAYRSPDLICCANCGYVKVGGQWKNPCRGKVKIDLRETARGIEGEAVKRQAE